MGTFILKIKILNVDKASPLSRRQIDQAGRFGNVYRIPFYGIEIAIKSFSLAELNQEQIQTKISLAIEEYCITKICDALECGPSVIQPFGFDLIIFNDRIEFAMEKCEPVQKLEQKEEQSLYHKILRMHMHKIIHFDIKP